MCKELPAYLKQANDEFISINGEPFLIKIELQTFSDVPAATKYFLQSKLDKDYQAQLALDIMNITGQEERLKRFTHCKFGGFDRKPDIEHDNSTMHVEYFDCIFRKTCDAKAQRLMCSCYPAPNGLIQPAEMQVMKLLAQGLSEKEIAAKLEKSWATVHSQTASIRQKIDGLSVQDIVRFAVSNNII